MLSNVVVELPENSTVMINVYDINGRIVYANTPNDLPAGKHVLQLNTDKYQAGTYTVEVMVNDNKTRQLIIVE